MMRYGLPPKQGLYDPAYEKDSCGIGFIADLTRTCRRSTVVVSHPPTRILRICGGARRALRARRDPDCPACGGREFAWLEGAAGARGAEVMCGGDAVQLPPGPKPADLDALAAKLDGTVAELRRTPHSLRFVVDGLELHLFADGRALVRGTEDAARARSVLSRTIGA